MNHTPDDVIPEDVRADIVERLGKVEREHDDRILFAIESGSRAWGFSSPNSDYDVRFIYMRDPSWYQAVDLEERRDVIEYPIVDDIDLNGWDVRKALRIKCSAAGDLVSCSSWPLRARVLNGRRAVAEPIIQTTL